MNEVAQVSINSQKQQLDFPWNQENAPVEIKMKARLIPTWTVYNEMAGPQPFSFCGSAEGGEQEITLIPSRLYNPCVFQNFQLLGNDVSRYGEERCVCFVTNLFQNSAMSGMWTVMSRIYSWLFNLTVYFAIVLIGFIYYKGEDSCDGE